jgi:integrase
MDKEMSANRASPGELFELPARVITKNGAAFDPRLMRWQFRDQLKQVDANFHRVVRIGNRLLHSFKGTLIWYAENRSPSHLQNMFSRMTHMFEAFGDSAFDAGLITSPMFLNYFGSLGPAHKWYAGNVAGFLRKWHALGYEGVEENCIELLDDLTLKGNEKGRAVLTFDSYDGPLNELEYQSCWALLVNVYNSHEIGLESYVLLGLNLALGMRPVQLAALRVCDVIERPAADGLVSYFINVPRAKNRLVARSEFKLRVLEPRLGRATAQLASEVRTRFADVVLDTLQAPLFPMNGAVDAPHGFEFHRDGKGIGNLIRSEWDELLGVVGDPGQPHITATRMRRTLGTRAAQEGYGALVIAELLDHSDTQNVLVYTQATPDLAMRIDRAMASELAALARVFRGRVIEGEHQATRADDPSSRIVDLRIDPDNDPMGNCAKMGPCGLLAPIACYTCDQFEPWVDGPHEAVIHWMLSERTRMIDEGEPRIASALDLQIVAAAEVADRCEAMRVRLLHG